MDFNNIGGIIPSSFCDWPGRITTVLFLCGCNFRCPTCHNKNLLNSEGFYLSSIQSKIERLLDWVGSINISGGEPLIYDKINDLVKYLFDLGFDIKIDTNGTQPETISKLLPYTTLFAVDVKGPFCKYPALTGNCISEEKARSRLHEIFELAKQFPSKFHFRTTKVPTLTSEDLQIVKDYVPKGFEIKFQDYISQN